MGLATEKQVNYALLLMQKAGYGVSYMSSEHKALGASMRERQGSVQTWLRGRNIAEMSALIGQLKGEVAAK